MFAIGIVAHDQRMQQARTLADKVNAIEIGWDNGQPSTYAADANHIATWKRLAKWGTEWSVVLEDDAESVPDFDGQLRQALDAAPTQIVSLYLGRAFPIWWQPHIQAATEKVQANDASFIRSTHLLHCVGVAIKTDFVPYIVQSNMQGKPIDEHITIVAQRYLPQPAIAYTWPSLVDHNDDLPSVIRNHNDSVPRTPGRKAWHTGQRIAWDNTTVEMWPQ